MSSEPDRVLSAFVERHKLTAEMHDAVFVELRPLRIVQGTVLHCEVGATVIQSIIGFSGPSATMLLRASFRHWESIEAHREGFMFVGRLRDPLPELLNYDQPSRKRQRCTCASSSEAHECSERYADVTDDETVHCTLHKKFWYFK